MKQNKTTKKRKNQKNKTKKRTSHKRNAFYGGNKTASIHTVTKSLKNKYGLYKYLQLVCPISGYCMGFGYEMNKITNFFNNYDFQYIHNPIKLLSSGANGFVNELIFEKDSYKVSTILKSTKRENADNLFLEAYIGMKQINNFCKFFPCFLETYKAYKYTLVNESTTTNNESNYKFINSDMISIHSSNYSSRNKYLDSLYDKLTEKANSFVLNPLWKQLNSQRKTNVSIKDMTNNLLPIPINLHMTLLSCDHPINNAILIQYVSNPISFNNYFNYRINTMSDTDYEYVYSVSLVQCLYQIYSVLGVLENGFTHYDLHHNNVFFYEIPDNKYITMNYYREGILEVSFKTHLVVKILDYGRCYTPFNIEYYNTLNDNLQNQHQNQHQQSIDNKQCGYDFFDFELNEDNFYTSQLMPNKSHDLRLVSIIKNEYNLLDCNNCKYITHALTEVEYNTIKDENTGILHSDGSPPLESDNNNNIGFSDIANLHIDKIKNVSDMSEVLYYILKMPYFKEENNRHYLENNMENKEIGILNIDLDKIKDMEYIPYPKKDKKRKIFGENEKDTNKMDTNKRDAMDSMDMNQLNPKKRFMEFEPEF